MPQYYRLMVDADELSKQHGDRLTSEELAPYERGLPNLHVIIVRVLALMNYDPRSNLSTVTTNAPLSERAVDVIKSIGQKNGIPIKIEPDTLAERLLAEAPK